MTAGSKAASVAGILLALAMSPRLSCAQADETAIRSAVENHLQRQVRGLPGKASFVIESLSAAQFPPCQTYDVFTTPGARAWGRSSVTVKCLAGASWSLLVPVRIQVIGPYLVSARAVSAGQTLTAADVSVQEGDLAELPAGTLTDSAQAVGQVAKSTLATGRPLRGDMLKARVVVQQGQTVKVVSRGPGFEAANEGKAMNSGGVGQVVQVRLANGQIVSGVASSDGHVEIRF